jgi:hypothetical protein
MDSADTWAADARKDLEVYVQGLLGLGADGPAIMVFFESIEADNEAYALFRSFLSPDALDVALLPPPSDIFAVFDEKRTWKPLLSRLPGSNGGSAKMLTLLRIDASSAEFSAPGAVMLVPRAQWAVVELARWREGSYSGAGLARLRASAVRAGHPPDLGASAGQPCAISEVVVDGAAGCDDATTCGGRVLRAARRLSLGDVVFEEAPFVLSPFEFTAGGVCFHCGTDRKEAGLTTPLVPALCDGCWVEAFAYCGSACKAANEGAHRRECALLRPVLEAAIAQGTAAAESGGGAIIAPFKTVLVLRAGLKASRDPAGWRGIRGLQVHVLRHLSQGCC